MKPKTLIVAHDAGGAEVLSAWCQGDGKKRSLFFTLAGPARDIFHRDFPELTLSPLAVLEGFNKDDFVLTGSSLEADLERQAIAMARRARIRCITFLDHWDLYRERFGAENNWREGLPDEVWTGDHYARDYALSQGFPGAILKLIENPYHKKLIAGKEEFKHLIPAVSDRYKILYICEPISRKLKAAFGPADREYDDELQQMEKFLSALGNHRALLDAVTLRLHPSESPDKYLGLVSAFASRIPVAISGEPLLIKDILRHSIIVGIESNALVIALLLGKEVFSCITGKQWKISLPHAEIRRITSFNTLFEPKPLSNKGKL